MEMSLSVLLHKVTTRITGCGGKSDHFKQAAYRIPVHAIVSTRVGFLPLCDFLQRDRATLC